MRFWVLASAFAVVLALSAAASARSASNADPSGYTMVDLGAGPWSEAVDINDKGLVIGRTSDGRLFTWHRGAPTDLGDGTPFEVNNKGEIVGSYPVGPSETDAVLWSKRGLTNLGGEAAVAINERGWIVGWDVLWRDGTSTAIPGARFVQDINHRGLIAGQVPPQVPGTGRYRAAVWDSDLSPTVLDTPPGYRWCTANKVNDRGQVAGICGVIEVFNPRFPPHAYLWEDGTAIDLGPAASLRDLNDRGQALVSFVDGSHVVEPDGDRTHLDGIHALGINNKGQIVGVTSQSPTSEPRAVLLDPR